jgi:speckle-type POZ protein
MGNLPLSFAGVSVVGVGSPPQPPSATTAVTYGGYHLLVVNGYSRIKNIPNGECIASRHFRVGGYRWIIQCYPNGYKADHDGSTSFYLLLDQGNVVDPVTVHYGFSFVDVNQAQGCGDSSLLTRAEEARKFSSRDAYSFPCSVTTRRTFEKSKHLKNDSFTIRCDIVIKKEVTVTNAHAAVPANNVSRARGDIEQHLAGLLRSGLGADVTFQVGGETFAAHRCVLAARSAVFKAQLFGPMKEGTTTNSVIPVSDMEERVFQVLLDFVYSDGVTDLRVETEEDGIMWQHLLVAADRYDLPRLKLICETMLCAYYINTSTVASILALADQHHCRGLKETCLNFLSTPANLKEVMVVDDLDHVISSCPSVLKELIAKLASLEFDVNTEDTGAAAPALLEVPESDICQDFSRLLESKERTDVIFEVGGETYHAHRCVLAARSAVFRAELFGPTKDATTGVIRIDGMEAKVFRLLLTFIYDDSMPKLNEAEENGDGDESDAGAIWQQLLVAANRYSLQRLRLMCQLALCRYINATTVAAILALAEEHHCQELKKECLDFLDSPANLQDVMTAGGLEHLRSSCPSVLIDLIAQLASLNHDTT